MPPRKRKHMSESEPPAVDVAKSELVDGFANLLSTGKGSNLIITCNGTEFKVHKVILASRSKFFETACWGDFAEAQSNSIDLPDDDAELVKKMLDYFYLLDYGSDKDTGVCVVGTEDVTTSTAPEIHNSDDLMDFIRRHGVASLRQSFPRFSVVECLRALAQNDDSYYEVFRSPESPKDEHKTTLSTANVHSDSRNPLKPVLGLAVHASMYGIADKYAIQGLKSISVQKLKAALRHSDWNLDFAQSYPPNMVEELAAAVQAAWTSTPESDRGVRAPLLDHALENKEILLTKEGFKNVVQQTPQFAWDLLARTQTY